MHQQNIFRATYLYKIYFLYLKKMGKVNKANLCSLPEIAAQIAMSRFYSQIITDIMMVLPLETSGYASSFRHKWS